MPYHAEDVDKGFLEELIGNSTPIIFDIGCCNGTDAINFLRLIPGARVFAFDGDPRSQRLFLQALAKEAPSVQERATLAPLALGNVDGEVEWYASDSDVYICGDSSGMYPSASSLREPKMQLEIAPGLTYEKKKTTCARLDSWVANNLKETDVVDLVWADVNGGEEDLIHGGINFLRGRVRYLYIEFSDRELFKGQATKAEIKELLGCFLELGVWSYLGNFGNVLLQNVGL